MKDKKKTGAKEGKSNKTIPEASDKPKFSRIKKQIKSSFSPQFIEKKVDTNAALSRSGRPLRKSNIDENLIPTDIMLYVSKYSPKRTKPKTVSPKKKMIQTPTKSLVQKVFVDEENPDDTLEMVELQKNNTEISQEVSLEETPLLPTETKVDIEEFLSIMFENGVDLNIVKNDEKKDDEEMKLKIPEIVQNGNDSKKLMPTSEMDAEEVSADTVKYSCKTIEYQILFRDTTQEETGTGHSEVSLSEPNKSEDIAIPETKLSDLIAERINIKPEPDDEYNCLDVTVMKDNIQSFSVKKEQSEMYSDACSDISAGNEGKTKEIHHDFSDTDSALGSAASYNGELKICGSNSFFAGQILWGSFSRFSWFPCMAYPVDDGSVFTESKTNQIQVKYFNWNGCTATLPIKNVLEFKDIDSFWHDITSKGVRRSRIKSFSKSCLRAIEEANFFKQFPVNDRVKLFDDVLMQQFMEKSKKRTADRKSVDSALDSNRSATPTSPTRDYVQHIENIDPVRLYFVTMRRYDEKLTPGKTLEKKVLELPKSEIKKEPVEEKQETDSDRRKSIRVRKIKIDDIYVSDSVRLGDDEVRSPAIPPKSKKNRVAKEETLEERFLLNIEDQRFLFRNVTKKRACHECLEISKEPTYRCNGNMNIKCPGWFHEKCSGHFELRKEEIRHQTGDSDSVVLATTIKTILACKSCHQGFKNCYICHQKVDSEIEDISDCPVSECRLSFHKKCLKNWPQNNINKANGGRLSQCPQHMCHTCFSKDIHNSGSIAKCVKCPAAYHTELSCIPAGTKIISQFHVICPRHPTQNEIAKNVKEKYSKPLNIDWCNICVNSGQLVCCESCPNAYHPDCINYTVSDEKFTCQECQAGRLPLYNTIVWARVGTYRWWPALIMPNVILPEQVLRNQKNEREFCVRFFGSYDYFWCTCERVILYDGNNVGTKNGNTRLDYAFSTALMEAETMAKILDHEDANNTVNCKPKPYTRIIMNRPVPPVKLNRVGENVQEPCHCSPDDENPCGKDSNCINMLLNFECSKNTCPAGAKCQNQNLRNRKYAEIKIVKTKHRGFGAISEKDIEAGTFIIEYVGELIDSNEMNRRMTEKIKKNEKEFYFLTVESDLYVDAELAANQARFINHSCEPNCDTRKVTVDGNTRIGIFSNQKIKAGTELTFDYQMQFVSDKKTACFCGSNKCSGLIGEKPKEEKKTTQPVTGAKKKTKRRRISAIVMPKKMRQISKDESLDPFEVMMASLKPEIIDTIKKEEM